jgi:AmpD protein
MQLTDDKNWVEDARRVVSPNCDERPQHLPVSLLVVHGISLPPGEYGGSGIDEFFCNRLDPDAHEYFACIKDLRVSSHLLIRRDGELVQYVPFSKRAWHAGQSCFKGQEACNDYSIGIELEGQDDEAYTEVQYQQLAATMHLLRKHYSEIDDHSIVGHSDIAPGRKTDPGPAFDWPRLYALLKIGH